MNELDPCPQNIKANIKKYYDLRILEAKEKNIKLNFASKDLVLGDMLPRFKKLFSISRILGVGIEDLLKKQNPIRKEINMQLLWQTQQSLTPYILDLAMEEYKKYILFDLIKDIFKAAIQCEKTAFSENFVTWKLKRMNLKPF
jgi:hypothetical protein